MGNKKGLLWYCILFTSPEKSEIFKVLKCNTINEMSYYLDIEPQTLRNYYHRQIKCLNLQNYNHQNRQIEQIY